MKKLKVEPIHYHPKIAELSQREDLIYKYHLEDKDYKALYNVLVKKI